MIKGFTPEGTRRIAKMVWRIGLVVLLFLWLHPVTYRSTQAAVLLLLIALSAMAPFLWKQRWVKITIFAAIGTVLLVVVMPGRAPKADALRADYVKALRRYQGTPYVWGGENRFGIDCSGLVRRGFINALLKEGLTTGNPGLVRESFSLRWHDCSAKALLEEYRGTTLKLFAASSIQALDESKLLPGDFAVTADGVHTLAYIGNAQWIEADPGPGRVVVVKASENNGWLKLPVELMRWRTLQAPE